MRDVLKRFVCPVLGGALIGSASLALATDRPEVAPVPVQPAPRQSTLSIYDRMVAELPVLEYADRRGDRWPMVIWQNPVPENLPMPGNNFFAPMQTITTTQVQNLLNRGYTQTIPQHSMGFNHWTLQRIIDQARAIQTGGSPVIMLEGKGGWFPMNTSEIPPHFSIHDDPWDLSGSPDFEYLQRTDNGQFEWTGKIYPNTRWQHEFDASRVTRIDPATGQPTTDPNKVDVYGRPVYQYVTARDGSGNPTASQPIGPAVSLIVGFENQKHNPAPLHSTYGGTLATMNTLKDEGITVNAVWHDWEALPLWNELNYNQSRDSKTDNPWGNGGTEDQKANSVFRQTDFNSGNFLFSPFTESAWRVWMDRMAEYIDGPTREVFPDASTTNWFATYSSDLPGARPVYNYTSFHAQPTTPVPSFTAMNPVAYATDAWHNYAKNVLGHSMPTQEHVDQAYTWMMLQQQSSSEYNLKLAGVQKDSIAWVTRWDPVQGDYNAPMMSRERYRESLRHLWLRGIDGIQIFSLERPGYEEYFWQEIVDANVVYDEMLRHAHYLNHGEVMNFDLPSITIGGFNSQALWSGLKVGTGNPGDSAVVRTYMQGWTNGFVTIQPWSGKFVTLSTTVTGNTYLLFVGPDGQVISGVPDGTWNVNASGNWATGTNWTAGSPNGIGATAVLGGAINTARTLFSDIPVRLGTLRFNNANRYLLTGTGTLTMDAHFGPALIDVLQGSHRINLPLHMAVDTDVNVNSGAALTIADPWTLVGGITVNKNGTGSLTVQSTLTASGPVTIKINGGVANFDAANNDPNITIDIDPATVNFGGHQTLGTVRFTDGDNVLNVGRTSSGNNVAANLQVAALVSVGGGTDAINTTLSGNTVTVSSLFGVGAANTLVKSGDGVLNVLSSATHSHGAGSTLQVDGGVVNLNSSAGGNLSVVVNSGTLNLNAAQKLDGLSVADGQRVTMARNRGVLFVTSLDLGSTGVLDLDDNDLIVSYSGDSPLSYLQSLVIAGYRAQPDATATGIISSTSQSRGGDTILVLIDNAALYEKFGVGMTQYAGYDIDTSTIIGMYTYFGDVNLDGRVTGDDFALIVSNLGMSDGADWLAGDMNFDGIVTGDDVALVTANLGKGVDSPLGAARWAHSAVPEPGAVGFLALAGAVALLKRGRRGSPLT